MAVSPVPDDVVCRMNARASGRTPARAVSQPPGVDGRRLLMTLNHIPQSVCVVSPDHAFRLTNTHFCQVFADHAGKKCFEVMRNRSEPCANCPMPEADRERGAAVSAWTSPSGRTYELCCHPFREGDAAVSVIAIGNDITDQLQRERTLTMERDKLQGILDGMNCGVYIVGPQYEVLYTNPSLEAGFGPADGRKCYQHMHDRKRPCPWCLGASASDGDTVRHEWESDRNGKTYEVIATRLRTAEGAVSRLHVLHDVTERKRMERALHDSAARLRAVSTHLLGVQESEKFRVSRELHDTLAQSLGSLKLRLALIRNQLHDGQQEARADCEDTLLYVDEAIETVRRLSRELLPTTLADLGLGTALRRFISQFSRVTEAKVQSRVEDVHRLLPKEDEILIFRIFQEALENVKNHASARNVTVVLERLDREIHGLVEDDGSGFDPQGTGILQGKSNMGLTLMAERIRILGGTLTLKSESGKGTRISFAIPLTERRPRS